MLIHFIPALSFLLSFRINTYDLYNSLVTSAQTLYERNRPSVPTEVDFSEKVFADFRANGIPAGLQTWKKELTVLYPDASSLELNLRVAADAVGCTLHVLGAEEAGVLLLLNASGAPSPPSTPSDSQDGEWIKGSLNDKSFLQDMRNPYTGITREPIPPSSPTPTLRPINWDKIRVCGGDFVKGCESDGVHSIRISFTEEGGFSCECTY